MANWYRGHLREEDSLLRSVVYPQTLRMLGPCSGERVLDVACGEGSFAELLARADAIVTGFDASPALIRQAEQKRIPHATFHVADARQFTLPGAPYAAAVCLLALQNIDPMAGMFRATAAALRPGAPLVVVMNHPCFRIPRQSSWGWEEQRQLQYRRIDRYLAPLRVPIQAHPGARPGVTTVSFHRPLSQIVAAGAAAGFTIHALEEWTSNRASDSGPRARAENRARMEIPMFLAFRAVRAA